MKQELQGLWILTQKQSISPNPSSQSRLSVAKKTPVHGAIVLACDVRCLSCSLGTTATAKVPCLMTFWSFCRIWPQKSGNQPTNTCRDSSPPSSINLPRNSLEATHQSICEFASTAFTLIGYQGICRWGPHAHATWLTGCFHGFGDDRELPKELTVTNHWANKNAGFI